jgi:recombinational DNA repair protein RecR
MAMTFFATAMNMDYMQKEIKRLQTVFRCKICKQQYEKDWCKADESTIHTRMMILRDMEWCYIQSGSENRNQYYHVFNKNLHLWCNHFHIPQTKEEYEYILDKFIE